MAAWADKIAVEPHCMRFKTCCDLNPGPGKPETFDLGDDPNSDGCFENSQP